MADDAVLIAPPVTGPAAPTRPPATDDRRYVAMLALLLACLAAELAVPLATLPFRLSWNYGEGWNAYWAARAMAGAPLYTDAASPITNNYPPLSFYLFGWAGRLAGDQIIGGRLLSLAALIACAALVGAIARRLGARPRWAATAAIGFLAYVAGFGWRYVATNDPQWLAAAIGTAGLLALMPRRGDRLSTARVAIAALLMVTAGLIKHNQLAGPAAVTLWLAATDRRALGWWIGCGAAVAGSALALLHARFGPALFHEVLHHERVMRLVYLQSAVRALAVAAPEMGLAVALWLARPRLGGDRRVTLLLIFTALAIGFGLFERTGTGVSVNAHFDAAIGCFAAAGVALGRRGVMPARARLAMSAVALLPLVIAAALMLPGIVRRVHHLPRDRARWAGAIATIREARGPVACELLAACYWAGRPFTLDFYNYGQKLRLAGDPIDLRGRLARREFAALVVVRDMRFRRHDARLPDPYNRLIEAGYTPARIMPDHAVLLRRR